MATDKNTWYTFVSFGSDPMPARGPFRSIEEADAAMENFQARHGHLAGTWLASGSVRMVGPYPTRAKALAADISTASPTKRQDAA
jgi:hypothetical protein